MVLNNGFCLQYGKNLSWQQILFPVAFSSIMAITIVDLGSNNAYGFKTIYNQTLTYFYINTKASSGSNFTTNCYWIACGT